MISGTTRLKAPQVNDPRNLTNLTAPTLQGPSQLESYYFYLNKNRDHSEELGYKAFNRTVW